MMLPAGCLTTAAMPGAGTRVPAEPASSVKPKASERSSGNRARIIKSLIILRLCADERGIIRLHVVGRPVARQGGADQRRLDIDRDTIGRNIDREQIIARLQALHRDEAAAQFL